MRGFPGAVQYKRKRDGWQAVRVSAAPAPTVANPVNLNLPDQLLALW